MRFSCLTSKFVCSSEDVNVFQWNREWFFSRRVKLDSWFNVMEVNEVSWPGPKVINCFTGIRKRVMKWWKRPFWFSKKINVTFYSNWSIPYQGGCSQVLSRGLIRPSAIGKIYFPFSLGNITSFALKSFLIDFRCVHRLQLLNVCNLYVTLPNSTAYKAYPRNYPNDTFFPNWWTLDWSFAVIRWYSTSEPNGIMGPLNGCPTRLSYGVFPSDRKSWTFRRYV